MTLFWRRRERKRKTHIRVPSVEGGLGFQCQRPRGPCPSCGSYTMRGTRGVNEDFRVCAHPCHGPLPEPYASNGRTFLYG